MPEFFAEKLSGVESACAGVGKPHYDLINVSCVALHLLLMKNQQLPGNQNCQLPNLQGHGARPDGVSGAIAEAAEQSPTNLGHGGQKHLQSSFKVFPRRKRIREPHGHGLLLHPALREKRGGSSSRLLMVPAATQGQAPCVGVVAAIRSGSWGILGSFPVSGSLGTPPPMTGIAHILPGLGSGPRWA